MFDRACFTHPDLHPWLRHIFLLTPIGRYFIFHLYIPITPLYQQNGRVVFLGKMKEYVACKQPNKKDKIPSNVTWEGSTWKSDYQWNVSRNIANINQNRSFWWQVHKHIMKLRSFSSLRFGLGSHMRSIFTKIFKPWYPKYAMLGTKWVPVAPFSLLKCGNES